MDEPIKITKFLCDLADLNSHIEIFPALTMEPTGKPTLDEAYQEYLKLLKEEDKAEVK